jgi:sterol desaturase/sphingolipid hydroxylase (fatty acid hydroxylase superfamily)
VKLLVLLLGVVIAVLVRGPASVGALVALAVIFVPVERLFPLRRQRVLRPSLVTDLTHRLVNGVLVTALTVPLLVAGVLPWLWLRSFDVQSRLPSTVAVVLAVLLVALGQYWGHRLTHQVPALWRFHAVHHSIEEMDWVASARLHPVDQAFIQAFTVLPLAVLGYDAAPIAGVGAALVLLALFQHANVRLRFPVVRWLVNTPEWHHWHHAVDLDARDRNFGLPIVDRLFRTAYLPAHRLPAAFGTSEPVPPDGYLRQLAHPFGRARVSDESSPS